MKLHGSDYIKMTILNYWIINSKFTKSDTINVSDYIYFKPIPAPSVALQTKVPCPEQKPRFVPSAPSLKTSSVEHWHHFPEICPSGIRLQTQWSFGHVPLPEQISVGIQGLMQSLQFEPGVGQSGRLCGLEKNKPIKLRIKVHPIVLLLQKAEKISTHGRKCQHRWR